MSKSQRNVSAWLSNPLTKTKKIESKYLTLDTAGGAGDDGGAAALQTLSAGFARRFVHTDHKDAPISARFELDCRESLNKSFSESKAAVLGT